MTTANQITSTNGSESCNTMTVGGNLRQRATDAAQRVKPFLSRMQFSTLIELCHGEEGDHFLKILIDLDQCIGAMPKTYEQDGLGEKAVAHLHYFMGGCDWWITEKDVEGGTQQAFGLVDMGHGPELGYISIDELVSVRGMNVDLHWKRCTLATIREGKYGPRPEPKPEPARFSREMIVNPAECLANAPANGVYH